ncbi:hypothetical protein JCM8097_007413 [Rhodosporidiobolus ruineniae]
MADSTPPTAPPAAVPTRKRPRTSPGPPARVAPAPPAPLPADSSSSSSAAPALPAHPAPPSAPNAPLGSLPLHPPQHYTSLAARSPAAAAFQLPLHLTSFSYSPTRELLLDQQRKDEALAVYREPRMGSDLNYGFEQATWRDGSVDEGLDALLDTLSNFAATNPNPPAAADLLSKLNAVTWRGMLTKLMLGVYETENVAQGRRGDGWEMNAMLVDGCLYLEESNPPAKLAAKAASESSYALQSYYGYSFESYCTQPPPSRLPPHTPPPAFEPPNTNVQWCSVVKTNLGGFRTVVGGEVDCVRPGAEVGKIGTRDFVELKTNMVIQSQRDEVNFERQKLLKHYVQSFLLGVPTVTVGFRTRQGQLTGLQHFNTLEVPRLVRNKPHAWDPQACLASARELLSFIHHTLSTHPASQAAECSLFTPSTPPSSPSFKESAPLPPYPVFRLSFSPSTGLSIRELIPQEVQDEVLAGKKVEERCGFLLSRWVREVRERRRAAKEREAANPPSSAAPAPPSATNPPHTGGRRVPPPPPPPPPQQAPPLGPAGGGGGVAGLKR